MVLGEAEIWAYQLQNYPWMSNENDVKRIDRKFNIANSSDRSTESDLAPLRSRGLKHKHVGRPTKISTRAEPHPSIPRDSQGLYT
jgi:hypothetical protein